MSKTRNLPALNKIFNFWLPCLIKMQKGDSKEDLQDTCFACGVTNDSLQRCHIIPRWRGGKDTCDNLHLLCDICHFASEDKSGKEYWAWFKKRNMLMTIQTMASFENHKLL
jgi:hypothetical protein